MKTLSVLALMLLVSLAQGGERLVRLYNLTDCTIESLILEGYDVASASAAV